MHKNEETQVRLLSWYIIMTEIHSLHVAMSMPPTAWVSVRTPVYVTKGVMVIGDVIMIVRLMACWQLSDVATADSVPIWHFGLTDESNVFLLLTLLSWVFLRFDTALTHSSVSSKPFCYESVVNALKSWLSSHHFWVKSIQQKHTQQRDVSDFREFLLDNLL